MHVRRMGTLLVAAALLTGCAANLSHEAETVEQLQRAMSERLVGRWRLERYDAATTLGKVLMSNILKEPIVVVFDGQRVRSTAGGMRLTDATRWNRLAPRAFASRCLMSTGWASHPSVRTAA